MNGPAEFEPPNAGGPEAQPKRRVNSASNMRAIIQSASKKLSFQWDQDRLVTDAYDRMPPMDPADLEKAGEAWRTNVDYGHTEKGIDEKVEMLNNLMRLPMPLVDFVTHRWKSDPSIVDGLNHVALEYDYLLNESPLWTTEGQDLCHQMVKTGLGIMYHPDPYSWHFESVERCNIVYPPRAGMNPDKWSWFAIRKDISIIELIAKLGKGRDAAEALGWKTSEVRKLLEKMENWGDLGKPVDADSDPEKFVNALQDNDVFYSALNNDFIKGFTVFIREFDGTVTEHLLVDSDNGEFIFTSNHKYESMCDFISLFPLVAGVKFLEKVRGYGHKVLPFNALINDLRNKAVDLTSLSSTLMLKGTKEDSLQDVTQLMLGNLVTLIPAEMSLDQRAFSNPAQGLVALDQNLTGQREANNRVFGGGPGTSQGVATATHAKILANNDSRQNNFETDRFYIQLTNFHRNVWKRLVFFATKGEASPPCPGREEALAFWAEVKKNGVTPSHMAAIRTVKANSLFGDGDPTQVFLALQDLGPILPSLPVTAQRDAMKMMIAARTRKPHLAEAWLPSSSKTDREKSLQLWRTATEHNSFETGGPMPTQDDDNTAIHADEHTRWAEGVIANMDNGVLQPEEVLQRLILVRDHNAAHMQLLSASEPDKALYADLAKRWQGIVNMMRRAEQMLNDKKLAEQQRMMEEMRNPRLSVAEQEAVLTGQTRRQELAETERLRREQLAATEALKRRLLSQGALTDAQLKVIESVPLIEPANDPSTPNSQ